MNPERAADVVLRWVRFYTRDVPHGVAERRLAEIADDLHDHIAHERVERVSERAIALSLLSRMARGMPADLSWRRDRSMKGNSMKPILASFAAGLALGALALVTDSPALVILAIVVILGGITGAAVLGLRTAQAGQFVKPFVVILAAALVVAAIGVSAIVFGERGDAPGLVLLGIVVIVAVIVGAFAFGVRTAQRSR